ncbi:hypothetical protein QQS21_005380 [Conoideocrella luteorostrata]|uniref:Uncharacterized protein n=1 Tax=Conoideocrella luteorostrata TaxID=1105319 RepID=A0AAJ0CSN3_9HYPO|nr:hypothetical protein QQS21_005380 [Conoideocrella luteorostrata]
MDYCHYLTDYDVMVCRECKIGVRQEHIDGHLKGSPHSLPKVERDQVAGAAQRPRSAVGSISGEQAYRKPSPHSAPLRALRPPLTNGFSCMFPIEGSDGKSTECGFVLASSKNMELHCRRVHGWRSAARRGRPRRHAEETKIIDRPWRNGVKYQRFYLQGPQSNFFEVSRDVSTPERDDGEPEGADPCDKLLLKLRDRHAEQEEAERKHKIPQRSQKRLDEVS